jgi:hypothetical protein
MAMREFHFDARNNVDWSQPFLIVDHDAVLDMDVPHDFGGESLRLQLKGPIANHVTPGPIVNHVIPNAVALELSTSNGMIAIGSDPKAGAFSINVPAGALNTLVPGVYAGDLLDFGANGSITTLLVMRLEVRQGQTVPTP